MIDYELIKQYWNEHDVALKKDFQNYCNLDNKEVSYLYDNKTIKKIGLHKNKMIIQDYKTKYSLEYALKNIHILSNNEIKLLKIIHKYKFITYNLTMTYFNCSYQYANLLLNILTRLNYIKIADNEFSNQTIYILTGKGFRYCKSEIKIVNINQYLKHELAVIDVAIHLSKIHDLDLIKDFKIHKELWKSPFTTKNVQLKLGLDEIEVIKSKYLYTEEEIKSKNFIKSLNRDRGRINKYLPDLKIEKLNINIEVENTIKTFEYMKNKYANGVNTQFYVRELLKRNPFVYTNIFCYEDRQKHTKVYDLETKELMIKSDVDKELQKYIITFNSKYYDNKDIKRYFYLLDESRRRMIVIKMEELK